MIQEERELLLKDLCARLPYHVKILSDLDKEFDRGLIGTLYKIEPYIVKEHPELIGQYLLYQQDCLTPFVIDEVRPYLRPMSSMTEEEWEDWRSKFSMPLGAGANATSFEAYKYVVADFGYSKNVYLDEIGDMISWLNAHHFDYRGLIKKGLAVEAPEGMYK